VIEAELSVADGGFSKIIAGQLKDDDRDEALADARADAHADAGCKTKTYTRGVRIASRKTKRTRYEHRTDAA
jgi:hypothetical protein